MTKFKININRFVQLLDIFCFKISIWRINDKLIWRISKSNFSMTQLNFKFTPILTWRTTYINVTFLKCILLIRKKLKILTSYNTSRNNPIQPIFKLPKGGWKLVECLPIIIKKIGKFGIAEFYISPVTCQKFDINDWLFVETISLN